MISNSYNESHRRVLRLAMPYKDRTFRPSALAALAGLPIDQAEQIANELETMGFIERVRIRNKHYMGMDLEAARGVDGFDIGVGYYKWAYENTFDFRLTSNGADEAERLTNMPTAEVGTATARESHRELRAEEACRALEEHVATLTEENASLKRQRLAAASCPRCHAPERACGRFCARCGSPLREITATAPTATR